MHAASGVVSGIIRDLFHGKEIVDWMYKVEVQGLMLLDAPQPFPNYNDLPTQLLFKQVVVNSSYGKVQWCGNLEVY